MLHNKKRAKCYKICLKGQKERCEVVLLSGRFAKVGKNG